MIHTNFENLCYLIANNFDDVNIGLFQVKFIKCIFIKCKSYKYALMMNNYKKTLVIITFIQYN